MSHFKGGGGRSTVERNDAKTRWELLLSLFWPCQIYSELEWKRSLFLSGCRSSEV